MYHPRPGQWVVLNDEIGLVVQIDDSTVTLHIAGADGSTLKVLSVHEKHLRRALVQEIPASRIYPPVVIPPSLVPELPTQKSKTWHWYFLMVEKILALRQSLIELLRKI